jgi:hypothetical protein
VGIPWEWLYHPEMNMGSRYCEIELLEVNIYRREDHSKFMFKVLGLLGLAGFTRPNALNLCLVKIFISKKKSHSLCNLLTP